jgi:hypothetical protein
VESSKIKNFVIIVLILLNVFFLIIAVSDFVRGKAEKNEMQSQLVMVMGAKWDFTRSGRHCG